MYIVWAGGGVHPPIPLDPSLGSSTFIVHEFTSIRVTNTGFGMTRFVGGGGEIPLLGASSTPQVFIDWFSQNTLLITPLVLPTNRVLGMTGQNIWRF